MLWVITYDEYSFDEEISCVSNPKSSHHDLCLRQQHPIFLNYSTVVSLHRFQVPWTYPRSRICISNRYSAYTILLNKLILTRQFLQALTVPSSGTHERQLGLNALISWWSVSIDTPECPFAKKKLFVERGVFELVPVAMMMITNTGCMWSNKVDLFYKNKIWINSTIKLGMLPKTVPNIVIRTLFETLFSSISWSDIVVRFHYFLSEYYLCGKVSVINLSPLIKHLHS